MKLESFSLWLFLYHQESGKQCPRIAIRLLALLVGDSPSPFEHRISFCGCAFLRNAFHRPAAVRKYKKRSVSGPAPVPFPVHSGVPPHIPSAGPRWLLRPAVPAFPRGSAGTRHSLFSFLPTMLRTRPASS